jgi:hypothetical protein
MTPAEILRAAKALIADPKRWTMGEYARDTAGAFVSPTDPAACCFCAIGALARAAGRPVCDIEREDLPAAGFLQEACRETGAYFPHRVNDDGGHAAVMAMYDRAISLAEASSLTSPDRQP